MYYCYLKCQQQKINNLNTLNIDNVIGTSNLPHSNVQNNSSFNTLITLKKLIDAVKC